MNVKKIKNKKITTYNEKLNKKSDHREAPIIFMLRLFMMNC